MKQTRQIVCGLIALCVALSLVACGDDKDSTATTTAATTPATATASTIPATAPSSTATPETSERKTGIEAVDAILTALSSGEPMKIEPFLGYAPRACASSPQIGGPPKCEAGEAEGTVARIVPISVGEGTYLRQGQDVSSALQRAFPEGTSIYAVCKRKPAPGNFPRGSYVVVTEAPGVAARSVDIEQGKIIYMNLVPSNTAAKLVEGIQQNDFVLPPR